MPHSSPSSARGSLKVKPSTCFWSDCWRCANTVAGSKPEAGSVPMPRRCWRRRARLRNLECVGETLRATLDDLAALAPEWLVGQIPTEWLVRYGHRGENDRLPKAEQARTAPPRADRSRWSAPGTGSGPPWRSGWAAGHPAGTGAAAGLGALRQPFLGPSQMARWTPGSGKRRGDPLAL
jgi:hypothetical protein